MLSKRGPVNKAGGFGCLSVQPVNWRRRDRKRINQREDRTAVNPVHHDKSATERRVEGCRCGMDHGWMEMGQGKAAECEL